MGRVVSGTTDVRVMQSFGEPRPTSNPYIHMLDQALGGTPGLTHIRFSWRTAFLGSYDVLHFHWPEVLLEGGTPLHRLARRMRFQALLWRLAVTRTPIVRTVHNIELPTGVSGWDRRMLSHVRDGASVSIALNPQTQPAGTTVVIPHGHYVDWFSGMPTGSALPGKIAFVGLVRRYKGVEALFDAYTRLHEADRSTSLVVAGRPTSEQTRLEVETRAERLSDVTLHLKYLSEPEYAATVTSAALIVLPYLHMHNSGSLLAALSLHRPVLVPDNDVNRALRTEVGPGWVHLFSGTLTHDDIASALRAGIPSGTPDLSRRGWKDAGEAHLRAYCSAAGRQPKGRS